TALSGGAHAADHRGAREHYGIGAQRPPEARDAPAEGRLQRTGTILLRARSGILTCNRSAQFRKKWQEALRSQKTPCSTAAVICYSAIFPQIGSRNGGAEK